MALRREQHLGLLLEVSLEDGVVALRRVERQRAEPLAVDLAQVELRLRRVVRVEPLLVARRPTRRDREPQALLRLLRLAVLELDDPALREARGPGRRRESPSRAASAIEGRPRVAELARGGTGTRRSGTTPRSRPAPRTSARGCGTARARVATRRAARRRAPRRRARRARGASWGTGRRGARTRLRLGAYSPEPKAAVPIAKSSSSFLPSSSRSIRETFTSSGGNSISAPRPAAAGRPPRFREWRAPVRCAVRSHSGGAGRRGRGGAQAQALNPRSPAGRAAAPRDLRGASAPPSASAARRTRRGRSPARSRARGPPSRR